MPAFSYLNSTVVRLESCKDWKHWAILFYGSDYYQFKLGYTFHDANSHPQDLLIIGHG